MVLEKKLRRRTLSTPRGGASRSTGIGRPGPGLPREKAKGVFCEDTGGPALLASVHDPSGQGYVAVSTAAMGRTIGDVRPRA